VTLEVNGEPQQLADGTPVLDVLALKGLSAGSRGIAVAVNGEVVARREWESYALADGDVVEVLVAVQGG